MKRELHATLLALLAAAAGCSADPASSSGDATATPPDVLVDVTPDADADAAPDAVADRSDVASDTAIAPDAAPDVPDVASPDVAGADAPAPIDVMDAASADVADVAEAAVDAPSPDVGPDAPPVDVVDVPVDVAPDRAPPADVVDAAREASLDVGVDAAPDVRPDVAVDALADAHPDAPADVASDARVSCATDPSACDAQARCMDVGGGPVCVCRCGYSGDGARCVDDYPNVLFVMRGGTGDGSCWRDALPGVAEALAVATPGTEIWVAAGTYVPGTVRMNTFRLRSGVAVYGGFNGAETRRDQRDTRRNVTVLSGDLRGDDAGGNYADNAYHVLDGSGVDGAAVVDGFTVRGGRSDGIGVNLRGAAVYAPGGAQRIANCVFTDNAGSESAFQLTGVGATFEDVDITGFAGYRSYIRVDGGSTVFRRLTLRGAGSSAIAVASGASLEVDTATFTAMTSPVGQGIYSTGAAGVTLRDATFTGYAIAVLLTDGNLTVERCTFANNTGISGGTDGAGVAVYRGGTVSFTDSVFRNNDTSHGSSPSHGAGIAVGATSTTIERCLFERNVGGDGVALFASGAVRVLESTFRQHTSAGAVVSVSGALTVRGSEFSDNTGGGALELTGGSGDVRGTLFARNVPGATIAAGSGGALTARTAAVTVVDCTFVGNRNRASGAAVSASYIASSGPAPTVDVVSSRFIANESTGGGALAFANYGSFVRPVFRVVGSEFIANRSTMSQGGVDAYGGRLEVTQCSFYNNTGPMGPVFLPTIPASTTFVIANSDFWTDMATTSVPAAATVTSSAGVALPAGAGNLALTASPFAYTTGADGVAGTADDAVPHTTGSVCVDHGAAASLPTDVWDVDNDGNTAEPLPLDVRGAPRVRGGGVDIGSEEQ